MAEPKKPGPSAFLIVCVERCGNALPVPFGDSSSWLSKRKGADALVRLIGRLAVSNWFASAVNVEQGWIAALCPECALKVYPPEVIAMAKEKTVCFGDPLPTMKLLKQPPGGEGRGPHPPAPGDPDYYNEPSPAGDPDYF